MNGDGMSPADVAAVVGNTDRNYTYPIYPYGNNGGFGSGFGSDWIGLIVILALLGGGFGFGGFGGGWGGGFGGMYEFPWLLTGQQNINANTNQGFDTLHLSNQVEGVRDGIASLSNQLCNCCADMNQTVSAGFANAEIAANARQMANMQQAFNNQIATLQGFNDVGSALCNASAENRLGQANLTATILSENCADRQALSEGVRDIIANQTASVQRILDQLCNDKIDAKNEKIADLQREILMKDLQASQVAQTADLRANNATVANQLVSELRSCPIPAQPVYGNTPIFTCNGNSGCGCGNVFGSTIA